MIAKSAAKEFLNRDLRDSRKAKRFTTRALDGKLLDMNPVPKFYTDPRKHQKVCFLLGVLRRCYMFLLDMGLGKTKIALDLLRYLIRCGEVGRGLVLVPNTVNIQSWINQVEIHQPKLRVLGVVGSREEREEVLDSDADLIVCTYMGWLSLVCERLGRNIDDVTWQELSKPLKKKYKRTKTGYTLKKGTRVMYAGSFTDKIAKRFQFVTYDEITFLQNPESLAFRVCRKFLKYASHRYGLTGTPFGHDPGSLWAQFFLIDGGETFGETQALFRAALFVEKENPWSNWPEYEFDARKKKQLNRMLCHNAIRYTAEECLDMPARTFVPIPVKWPEESWAYYKKLLDELVAAREDKNKRENVWHRMRQLCSGYLCAKGAHDEQIDIVFAENPKLDAVVDSIQQMRPDRKMILFHHYRQTGELIAERFKKEGIKHLRLWSGTSDKDRAKLEHRMNHDPKVRVLVSSSAGAYGLNLQAANYVDFFESPSDPKMRKQMEARAWRQGQTRKVFILDTYIHNSIESRILKSLEAGKDLHDEVVDGNFKGLI